jgi:hypothetical protein
MRSVRWTDHPMNSSAAISNFHRSRNHKMPSLRGYNAYILNALTNTPLIEYQATVNGNGTLATCYVESVADQPFSIVLRDTAGLVTQGTAVYVDGIYIDNGLTGPGIATERSWFGKRIDHINIRPFIFRQNPSGHQTIVQC